MILLAAVFTREEASARLASALLLLVQSESGRIPSAMEAR
jgi:hypothetical protein